MDKLSFSELEAKLPKLAKCFINQGCNMDDYENVSYWKGVKRMYQESLIRCFSFQRMFCMSECAK